MVLRRLGSETWEFGRQIVSVRNMKAERRRRKRLGVHFVENIRTCNDVTIYLISIVTTIILVIADPILCNANRDTREFIISTFKCYKEWKKNNNNKKQWVCGVLVYYYYGNVTAPTFKCYKEWKKQQQQQQQKTMSMWGIGLLLLRARNCPFTPTTHPPPPPHQPTMRDRPHHRGLRLLLFSNSNVDSFPSLPIW